MSETLTPSTWILSFTSEQAASAETGLSLAGGKGSNLARLTQAGFPVPGGFLLTTQAYRDFVSANGLEERILNALPDSTADAETLELASEKIRAMFAQGLMPGGLAEEAAEAYARLGAPPVAVRSSATAEDLPEMSFAGQQDTFLNVQGVQALLQNVVNCWSSLWTARAIGYRTRNRIPQAGTALAVVVQAMVESQASGVLFTANPLTGLRTETVIEAAFGLGEALVSGMLEPDRYIVNVEQGLIVEKRLGAKEFSIHGQVGGGTVRQETARKDRQALEDVQILALAQLGQQAASLYGAPQDIEWAWADGKLSLLQSRAITSLFPTPEGIPLKPLNVLVSFGAVQGLLDPLTPTGTAAIRLLFSTGARLFGIHVTPETQTIVYQAGERAWINITSPLRNTVGRRAVNYALELVEPTVKQALEGLRDDPLLQPERKGIRPKALLQITRFVIPLVVNIALNMVSPRQRREMIVAKGEDILQVMRSRCAAVSGAPRARLAQFARLMPEITAQYLPGMFRLFISGMASGMASYNFIKILSKDLPADEQGRGWQDTLLELTRGLPNNPTSEMDLELWRVARAIQSDPELMLEFQAHDASGLAARYYSAEMLPAGRALVAKFLVRYGGRGLGEIDLGRVRWNEDPTHVFEVLSSYLQITRPDQAPDVVFARGEGAAQAALDRICAALRKTRGGWIKARQARFLASRMRQLLGLRESPKFFAVRLMGLLRAPLLQVGEDLVQAGDLAQPDDLFYLSFDEMAAFATCEPRDWKTLIARRRDANQREKLRRQVPRLLLSDGRAFYEGIRNLASSENTLTGSPVSPGRAEGSVRVVLNPRQASLRPGEILVCPGTDPSWTPLFLSASGLVMEVGGMMTHGAVVAREYGIPAIVGVNQATSRLKTGQKIRIDGSTGQIELLD